MIRSDTLIQRLNPCERLVIFLGLTGNGDTYFLAFTGDNDLTAMLSGFCVRITNRERRGLVNEVLLTDSVQRSREMRIGTAHFCHNIGPSNSDILGRIGVIYHARTKGPFVGRSGELFEFHYADAAESSYNQTASSRKFEIACCSSQRHYFIGGCHCSVSIRSEDL